jgi:hypothetical protein
VVEVVVKCVGEMQDGGDGKSKDKQATEQSCELHTIFPHHPILYKI